MTIPTPPTTNPDHDPHAAAIYRAIALRFRAREIGARAEADTRGGDLTGCEPLVSELEAGEQYRRAVHDFLWEEPETADAIYALGMFAAAIAADRLTRKACGGVSVIEDEQDTTHQLVAIAAITGWLHRGAMAEIGKKRIAAYGPSGMPSEGSAAQ